MAEEVEPAVAAVEEVQPEDAAPAPEGKDKEAAFVYDESLLIRVKGKVKRPAKPDLQECQLATSKLQEEITKHSNRIKEIKEIVENKRNSQRGANSGNQEIVRRLQALRNEFQAVLNQKQRIRDEFQECNRVRENLRNQSRSLRERLPRGVRVTDDLNGKIKELETALAHETMSLQEETRMQQQIQQFTSAKSIFDEYHKTEAQLKVNETARTEIKARLERCDTALNNIKKQEEGERKVLEDARAAANDSSIDVPALNNEKKECWEIIQVLRAKIDEIRKEFSAKMTEYIKLDKNYNAYLRADKRKKWEERQKEREARDADRAATDEAAAGTSGVEPYAAELVTLDQLLTYLRKFVAEEEVAAAEQKKEVEVPKGCKAFKKKEDDFSFYTTAPPKKGGKKGAAAPAEASSSKAAAPADKKKLNHSLETLSTFIKFSIEVPTTTAEIAATIEKVEAKKVHFLELRKKAKEAPPPRAAAPASTSNAEEAAEEPADEGQEEVEEGEIVEEAASQELPAEAAAATPSKPAASGDGLGLTLTVDDLTSEVSVKLNIA